MESGKPTFKELERSGWEARAEIYDARFGALTAQAAESLLDAVGAQPGLKLLDVATGTGAIAGAAAARGLVVTGIDFAPAMVALAAARQSAATFLVGDAELLPFAGATFDAVTCGFGLLHLARPDDALAQALHVLRPGGRFAFSVWCDPSSSKFHALVLEAVARHGDPAVELPPAPPPFRFSDHAECRRAMEAQGFIDVDVRVVPLVLAIPAEALLSYVMQGTVRMALLVEAQSPDARAALERAIVEGGEQYRAGDGLVIPTPAVIASGRKPVGTNVR
jgi:ubiquinone/menaquinone biosynthesis C-methylase UbiE